VAWGRVCGGGGSVPGWLPVVRRRRRRLAGGRCAGGGGGHRPRRRRPAARGTRASRQKGKGKGKGEGQRGRYPFRGLPVGLARKGRPAMVSSLSINLSQPQGRFFWACLRRRCNFSASSGSFSHADQSDISTEAESHAVDPQRIGSFPRPQCAAALDHGYSSARETILALTGLRST